MREMDPNLEVIEGLTADPSEGRYATVPLISYRCDDRYTAWLDAALPLIEGAGGRIVWAANDAAVIVGDPTRCWDAIAVVEYPSLEAFLAMIRAPAWALVEGLRVEAMDANEVYACAPVIDAVERS